MRTLPAVLLLLLVCCAPSGAQRSLIEWRFDDGEMHGWVANGDVTDVRTTGGALHCRGAGGDPIVELAPTFEIPASPWQAIEIKMKADRDGNAVFFWSSETKGRYGGFEGDKRTPFAVRGDGEWHTYRIHAYWQKEKTLRRLRFDPYDGAQFDIAAIRIVEDDAPKPGEWLPINGVQPQTGAAGTRLSLTAADGYALQSFGSADPESNPYVALRLSSDKARRISIVTVSDNAYGLNETSVSVLPDGKEHTYNLDMLNTGGWKGKILAVGVRPGTKVGESVTMRWLRVGDKPQGEPEWKLLSFGVEEAMPRTGRPVTFRARVTNAGGGTLRAIGPTLRLPNGTPFKLVRGGETRELRFGEEGEWVWQAVFSKSCVGAAELRVQSKDEPPVAASAKVEVTPRIAIAKSGIAPPKAVHGKLDVGVYYFPGWKSASSWEPITRFPERRPVLGWYREGEPGIADWQIRWAVEHGITFFAYDWYWNQGARSLEHGIHDGLFHAKYGNLLKFCLLWANHNPENTSSFDDCLAVTDFWIDNYFKRPEYYTLDGKPVVIIFSTYRFRSDMGSPEVRRAFDAMKARCVEKGLKGLYLIACVGDTGEAARAAEEGYDAVTAYNWPGLGVQGSEKWVPYSELLDGYRRQWEHIAERSPIPIMTPVSGGWDSRPWHGDAALVRYGRTPELFRRHLEQTKAFIESHPGKALPVALVEAWNEFGEGSYIEPMKEFGFGYLDAIRDVFTDAPRKHIDLTPDDAGQAIPQVEFSQATRTLWDADHALTEWGSGMGITEAKLDSGMLTVRTTNDDPAFFGPPVQIRAEAVRVIKLRMLLQKIDGQAFRDSGQLFWSTRSSAVSEENSVHFDVEADGQWHDYTIEVAANPRWRGVISSLRLDPMNKSGVLVQIERIQLAR